MDSQVPEHLRAYLNLPKFLTYRGFRLAGEALRPDHVKDADLVDGLTPVEVAENIFLRLGMWELVATRVGDPGRAMVIFLITEDSGYAHATQKLTKLLSSAGQRVGEAKLEEVILLATEEVVHKKNIAGLVREFHRKREEGAEYFMYPYCKFADVVPESPLVPRHEVISRKVADEYLGRFNLKPGQLPRIIAADDPAAIWCGARPGDFVRVWRRSETAASEVPVLRYAV